MAKNVIEEKVLEIKKSIAKAKYVSFSDTTGASRQ